MHYYDKDWDVTFFYTHDGELSYANGDAILKLFQDKILPLEEKAHLYRHIPNALATETFDRAEANFIQAFFGGDTKAYQDWRRKIK